MRKCSCGYEGYETHDSGTYQFHVFYQNVFLPTVGTKPFVERWAKMVCCPNCGAVYLIKTGDTFYEAQ